MRKRETLTCSSAYLCNHWLMCVPWPGIKPATLEYWDDAQTNWTTWPGLILFFLRFYLFIFRERGKEGRETSMWERNIYWLPLVHSTTGDWTCNLGMCPDQELNLWPFTLQDNAQPMIHTGQGKHILLLKCQVLQIRLLMSLPTKRKSGSLLPT